MGDADSRTRVILAQYDDAKVYQSNLARVAQLRHIAATVYCHEQRMVEALKGGWITAPEAVEYLDTQQPHARLSWLREQGLPIVDRWVLMRTANGGTRRCKAYTLTIEVSD